jgi:hypothetical protein
MFVDLPSCGGSRGKLKETEIKEPDSVRSELFFKFRRTAQSAV